MSAPTRERLDDIMMSVLFWATFVGLPALAGLIR